jgi:hypothetical protein
MQKIVQSLPILVIAVAIGIIAYQVAEHRRIKAEAQAEIPPVAEKVTADQLPVATNLPALDRQLVSKAFASPETLDQASVTSSTEAVQRPATRPTLLSETMSAGSPEAVETDGHQDAYFQKDFESLRTDAVRNPDSEQNRATVNTLMLKRQQRLAKEDL